MKISNTTSHGIIGLVFGAIIGMLIGFTGLFEMAVFSCIGFGLVTVGFESAQKLSSTDPDYISKKWLDSLVDIVAGNLGYNVMLWIIMWKTGYFA